jgi:glycosyltransferase involved in cell wall biosynthesis
VSQLPPYSITIRTLGKSGDNYVQLLHSISQLQPQPMEVIIAIPHGYDLPIERLGFEKFIRCDKGMVRQRVAGGMAAECEYILFLDDDLQFPSDLVSRLYKGLVDGLSQISFPIMFDTMLPQSGMRTLIPALTGAAVPMLFGRDKYYVKILANGGWSYNRFGKNHQNFYQSQSAPGPCFFAEKKAFLLIDFETETWVQNPGYAQFEDAVMFYKSFLRGNTPIGVPDTGIIHLDSGKTEPGRRLNAKYAREMNFIIFWHRFVFITSHSNWGKIFRLSCFCYTITAGFIIGIVVACLHFSTKDIAASIRGMRDAFMFIGSQEYRNLPPVFEKLVV